MDASHEGLQQDESQAENLAPTAGEADQAAADQDARQSEGQMADGAPTAPEDQEM